MAKSKIKGMIQKRCKQCGNLKKMLRYRVTCSQKCASKYRNSSERITKYKK